MILVLALGLVLIGQEGESPPTNLAERVAQLAGQQRCDEARELADAADADLRSRVEEWCEPAPPLPEPVPLPSPVGPALTSYPAVAPAPLRAIDTAGRSVAHHLASPPLRRPVAVTRSAGRKFTCATVHNYCREMRSCAEAKFALRQCGQSELDRDGDGVPCENICPGG